MAAGSGWHGMKRLLILNCSRYKRETPDLLPALERYDGPKFQTVREHLAQASPEARPITILILSARYGLITAEEPIPYYDERMTEETARALRPEVQRVFRDLVSGKGYGDVFILLSRDYRIALEGFEKYLPDDAKVVVARGPDHIKSARLRKWLSRP